MARLRCKGKANTLEDKEMSLLSLNTNIEFHVFTKTYLHINLWQVYKENKLMLLFSVDNIPAL